MINKVSYKLRRTLPGQSYDYEELFAEDTLTDEESKSPNEMLKGCIELCCGNTARARTQKTKE